MAGALMTLRRMRRPLARKSAELIAAGAVDELRSLPAELRVDAAYASGLPTKLAFLRDGAAALLAYVIEDDALRAALGELAVSRWLSFDREACVAHALPHAEQWSAPLLMELVAALDPSEAYDVVAERYRRDPEVRAAVAGRIALVQEPRFLELARAHVSVDPKNACALLAVHRAPAALEELVGFIVRAEALDDVVVAAVDALGNVIDRRELVLLLAALLSRPWAHEIVPTRIGLLVSMNAVALYGVVVSARERALIGNCRAAFASA